MPAGLVESISLGGNMYSGKRVLVTGASSGIGLAVAETFAINGAFVALNYLPSDDRGRSEVSRLVEDDLTVFSAQGDVSCARDAEQMVSQAIETLGGLDFLINNAGTALTDTPIPNSRLDQLTEEFWSGILSTNLIAPFRCTKAAAEALRTSHGAVVNTASVGGLDMVGSSMPYGASKAGLINLTKNLARGLAPYVRVNAVAPGLVETAWTHSWPEERKRALVDHSILRRACTAQDIADVIIFLCVGARMITGQTIVVDGGLSLGG